MTPTLDGIDHRDDCTDPTTRERRGRLGDTMLTCRGCKRFTIIPNTDTDEQPDAGTCQDCGEPCMADVPRCRQCYEQYKVSKGATAFVPAPPTKTETPGRYRLNCVRCPRVMHLHRDRPIVPLCQSCRRHRDTQRQAEAA